MALRRLWCIQGTCVDFQIGIYAFQYIFSDPNAPERSRKELMSLVPLDLLVDSAMLSDLHKIVLGIRHIDVREYLLLHHAPDDVNVWDIAGYTPLCYAAARADEATLSALLDAGAQPEFPHKFKVAKSLHVACQNANLEIVRILIRAGQCSTKHVVDWIWYHAHGNNDWYTGADVSVKSWLQRTPLIWLARCQVQRVQGDPYANDSYLLPIARELVQAGAEVSHEDEEKCAQLSPLTVLRLRMRADLSQNQKGHLSTMLLLSTILGS